MLEDQSGSAGTMTVNNSSNCSFNGYIRDHNAGTGTLALVKGGAGTLTLTGANCGGYTGGLTVNAGTLDYSGGTLPRRQLHDQRRHVEHRVGYHKTIGTFQHHRRHVTGTGTFTSNARYFNTSRHGQRRSRRRRGR